MTRHAQPRADLELPQATQAELALAAALMVDPTALDAVASLITANDILDDGARAIFQALTHLHRNGRAGDVVLLAEHLQKSDQLEPIGGVQYLLGLFDSAPTSAMATQYARSIREASDRRRVIDACTTGLQAAHDCASPLPEAIAAITSSLDQLRAGLTGSTLRPVGGAVADALTDVDAALRGERRATGLTTGIAGLDDVLSGMRAGELIIVAGRPGSGKSSLLGQIALTTGVREQISTLLFTLEMTSTETALRLACSMAGIGLHRARRGWLSRDDVEQLSGAANAMHHSQLLMDDVRSPCVSDIASTCRRVRREHGLKLVAIDYLSWIQPVNPREPREQQVAGIVRRLKDLAREIEVPVLLACQLNREVEKAGRPRLSHLRESGAIEQDADVVIFVHRDQEHGAGDSDAVRMPAEIIVAKQRNGPTGSVPVLWHGACVKFEERSLDPFQEDAA